MSKQVTEKGSAFLIPVALALTVIGLGIFVDGNVIAYHASSEGLMQETALAKSSLDSSANQVMSLDQSSEATQQLQQKIYLANQYDWHKTEAMQDKQAALNEKVNLSSHPLHHS